MANKKIASDSTDQHKYILANGINLAKITNQQIPTLNFFKHVPNDSLIKEIFDKLGVKRESTVSFLRFGISEDDFTLILSFLYVVKYLFIQTFQIS